MYPKHEYISDKQKGGLSQVWLVKSLPELSDVNIGHFFSIAVAITDNFKVCSGQHPLISFVLGHYLETLQVLFFFLIHLCVPVS